eukprot:gene28296-50127_t
MVYKGHSLAQGAELSGGEMGTFWLISLVLIAVLEVNALGLMPWKTQPNKGLNVLYDGPGVRNPLIGAFDLLQVLTRRRRRRSRSIPVDPGRSRCLIRTRDEPPSGAARPRSRGYVLHDSTAMGVAMSDAMTGAGAPRTETRRSFCRFCHAGCAIDGEVAIDADGRERVTGVRGVQDDPMYAGYTCVKGRHLGDQHHHEGRLRQSLVRSPGGFAPIAGALAFDQIADRVAAVLESHGPRSLATYCGPAAYQNATR